MSDCAQRMANLRRRVSPPPPRSPIARAARLAFPAAMLVLFETPAGHALFKVADDGKLSDPAEIFKHFETPDQAGSMCVRLRPCAVRHRAAALRLCCNV